MHHVPVRPHLLLFFLLHSLFSSGLDKMDVAPMEVIVHSSSCSVTCGLGVKTQTLCLLDSKTVMEEDVESKNVTEVTDRCYVRKVTCQETWQCGLRTMTVTAGQKVEIDCLEEVMKAMGRFSWSRGMITSDQSLFARWEAPLLDRVVMDPIQEENSGTYCCEVQDATYHRVKSIYWGIRVLPAAVVNLDYEGALAQWESNRSQGNQTGFEQSVQRTALLSMVLISLSIAGVGAGTMLLGLYWTLRSRAQRQ
ncbi:transmembrane protein 81 isoform X2 [Betta splendens]|uniref:Transmembrane protein 81 n=1 Tax=Betta splendens TaxID=158456 RepID=A0A6P7MXS6_BETSP|nr:transmembrane protein 81 isoform X2 [Betta splendens]